MLRQRLLNIIGDTGFGFSLVSLLFFSASNMVGFAATLIALSMIIGIKLSSPATAKIWVKDERTPMRIAGFNMLFVAFSIAMQAAITTAQASSSLIATPQLPMLAPFCSALFFGIANMRLAATITQRHCTMPLYKNAELFLFLGYIAVGFMSGADAIYAMPLVVVAFVITLKNCRAGNPAHTHHPIMIYALAEICFAVVAMIDGNALLFIANMLCAVYLMRIDGALTPGGLRTTIRDILSVRAAPSAML